jgi:hypothetical protein
MLGKVKCKIDERVTITSFLKVKSISVFDDEVILDTLNNPKYPIAFENDFLLLKLRLWMGSVGIQGSISLLLPPIDFDIDDLWDFCRKAGLWDVWSFLSFQYQYDQNMNPIILFNYNRGNFFENDLSIYKYVNVKDLFDNQELHDTVFDLLSTDPQTFEFPENLPDDYDYKGHYALAITQNFIEVLTHIWEFELIDNPMEA